MILYRKKVFVIEDNPSNLAIMKIMLEREGALVAFERWGKATLERLHSFAPVDVILSDLMFPNDVTGYDLFDEIRTVPEFVAIPIVAVSAAYPAEAIPKTRDKGFAGFIPKPIEFETFTSQILQIINGERVFVTR